MLKKVSSTLGLPRTQSLNSALTEKKKKNKVGGEEPIALDRYLTNEGHRLVASYLKITQIQKHIQKGSLLKITEKELDDLLKSYQRNFNNNGNGNGNSEGTVVNLYETLNYENLSLSLQECKLLAKLLKSDKFLKIKTLKLSKNNL